MPRLLAFLALLLLARVALGEGYRYDFTRSDPALERWKLSGGTGRWELPDPSGRRALSVTGNGADSNYWWLRPVGLLPNTVYRVRFSARCAPGSTAMTVIAGLDVVNRDFGVTPAWSDYTFIVRTPADVRSAFLRLGQWHLKGTVYFRNLSLTLVETVHGALGEGEVLLRDQYRYQTVLGADAGNDSKTLLRHTAPFNSNRWVFSGGHEVIYRHQIPGRRQTAATVSLNVNYYVGGSCVVSASRDGRAWVEVGRIRGLASREMALPSSLFPAEEVYVRLSGSDAADPAGDSAPGSFQVDSYGYTARLEGTGPETVGNTFYLENVRRAPDLGVKVESLTLAGASKAGASVLLTAAAGRSGKAFVRVHCVPETGHARTFEAVADIGGSGRRTAAVHVPIPSVPTGPLAVTLAAGWTNQKQPGYITRLQAFVPHYYDADYGHALPATPAGPLWWCESTYKVAPYRHAPTAPSTAIRISAARRERQHAQLVLKPSADPGSVRVTVTDLSGPGGARIPAAAVSLRTVEYVRVHFPTDSTGLAAEWPDPLPPLKGSWKPRAGRNNPLWITVRVPDQAAAGEYRGEVRLQAQGWSRAVPLLLRVRDFALPKMTSLRSGFGVDPGLLRRYHNLKSAESLERVWDMTMRAFADVRISPYNPMALAPYEVRLVGAHWIGGTRVEERPLSGRWCLRVDDNQTAADVNAATAERIPVAPGERYQLTWACRTAEDGQQYMVTVGSFDALGQWMPGRNIDIVATGTGEWQRETVDITERIPHEARSVQVVVRPTLWTERGENTGTAWFDEVALISQEGHNLVQDSGFEEAGPPRVTVDFRAFDRAAKRYLDDFGFNAFTIHIPGLGGGRHPHYDQGSFLGYAAGTPEYDRLMTEFGRILEQHLADNNWLRKAYVYWYDEPEVEDYPFVQQGMERLKRYFPRLKRMLTEEFQDPLYGHVQLWCPITPNYAEPLARARQRLGEEVWWYVCTGPKAPYCTLFIDKPAIELRMWLWQTWKYGVQGILIWHTNWWTSTGPFPGPDVQNPWEDPMSYVDASTGFWGNGDGRFFYPANRDPNGDRETEYVEAPISSLRWEMLGVGIQDWEYFRILADRVRAAEARGDRSPRVRAARELLRVPPEITLDMVRFTRDPRLLETHREKLADAIEHLAAAR